MKRIETLEKKLEGHKKGKSRLVAHIRKSKGFQNVRPTTLQPTLKNLCPHCTRTVPYMPPNYDCWTETPQMQQWLHPSPADFEVSKPRLSVTTIYPLSIYHCNH